MASELKPWKYEIKYGPEGEDAYSWVYDDNGAMVATMKTHKAKEIVDRMNTPVAPVSPQGIVISNRFYEHLIALTGYHITRPPTPDHEFVNVCNGDLRKLSDFMDTVAPVSPDATGKCGELETVGWLWEYAQYRTEDRGYYGYETVITENSPADHVSPIEKVRNSRELVTRSQAEELLAAERAEKERWRKIAQERHLTIRELITERNDALENASTLEADNAGLTAKLETANALVTCCCGNPVDNHGTGDGHSPVDQYHYKLTQLEEQNAALTARVKELEDYFSECISNETFLEQDARRVRQIEALEAKVAAAKKALKAARPYVEDYDTRRHNTGVDETLTQIDAALGGKPS